MPVGDARVLGSEGAMPDLVEFLCSRSKTKAQKSEYPDRKVRVFILFRVKRGALADGQCYRLLRGHAARAALNSDGVSARRRSPAATATAATTTTASSTTTAAAG